MRSSIPDNPAGNNASGGNECIIHASCVAVSGQGVLILGPSGSGKSALALQLIALGGKLVADDRTRLLRRKDILIASAPDSIRGMIEARGVGLLGAETLGAVPVLLALDLAKVETERLPPRRKTEILGLPLPLVHKVESPAFPAAIMQYLKGGRIE